MLLAQTGGPGDRVDGIDVLLVLDDHQDPDGAELRQRVLLVQLMFGDAIASLDAASVEIVGGVRVRDPVVTWASPMSMFDPAAVLPELSAASQTWLSTVVAGIAPQVAARTLVVIVEEAGDFSPYRLRLVGDSGAFASAFDPRSIEVEFSFKVECPTPFDCAPDPECPPQPEARPQLDYLARDFASFRQMMLARLAVLQPSERVQSPATLRTALVEVLAYAADREAYHQDAVATEAYLGTARLRRSIKRHARLLAYRVGEGCNARVFVHLVMAEGTRADPGALRTGATFLTAMPDSGTTTPAHVLSALPPGVQGFAAMMRSPALSEAHNEIALHTWGDEDCCILAGATSADLIDPEDTPLELAEGDFVAFEQVRSPQSNAETDADPDVRWVVRLTAVDDPIVDPLSAGISVRRIHWHAADAPGVDVPVVGDPAVYLVARANLIVADHGLQVSEGPAFERFGQRPPLPRVQARLAGGPLTFAQRLPPSGTPAASLLEHDPREAMPQVTLRGEDDTWHAVRDLFGSGVGDARFVVEMDDAQRAWLRFGDNVQGRRPTEASVTLSQNRPVGTEPPFVAVYRVGNGPHGNVGAEAIAHIVSDASTIDGPLIAAIVGVRNPLAAQGGTAPERVDEVRLYAPQAFRVQERAVTVADWAEVAKRHPRVSRAQARFRWTGSWTTVFVYIDLVGGEPVTAEVTAELSEFLQRYRMAGMDLEVRGPQTVPLDIALSVCVETGFLPEQVQRQLVRRFGSGRNVDGTLGFFHPDRFTFGQSVYLSEVLAVATAIPGVRWLDATPTPAASEHEHRFKRLWSPQDGTLAAGRIGLGALEIARCDSDPNAPENGRIQFHVRNPVEETA